VILILQAVLFPFGAKKKISHHRLIPLLFLPKLFVCSFLLAREAFGHVGLSLLGHRIAARGAALRFQVLKKRGHWCHVV
jgi:hypothetical protein